MAQNTEIPDDRDFIEMEEEIDLRQYLRIIYKRRRVVISVFSLIVAAGLFRCLTATPVYQATSGIIIDKEEQTSLPLQENIFFDMEGMEYYQTLQKIIESRSVAAKVIKQLGLDKKEAFFPQERDEGVDNDTLADDMIDVFLANLKITPVMKSHYVNIQFQSKDPALAAAVANAIVDAYREHALAMKLDSVQNSVDWLNSNLEQERKKVESSQKALLKYKEENNIVTDFSSNTETLTAQKLAHLNTEVAEAEAARTEAETRYNQAISLAGNPDKLASIPEVMENQLIVDIKKQEVLLGQKKSELSKKYGSHHPQMEALQSEGNTLQAKKEQEAQRIITSLSNTCQAARAREKSLRDALDRQKGEAFNLNRTAVAYTGLYCEAAGSQAMYELLLKRLKETSVTENLKIGNIRVVDKATMPRNPIKPKKQLMMLISFLLGLVVACGAAFLLEYFDDAINTSEDIKKHMRIPFLGAIPLNRASSTLPGNQPATPPALEAFYEPRSPITEAYRGVRTNIFYSLPESEPRVILVTSALAQEGKTTNATNIAITMAQFGYRVVLIDCDFHRPQMRKLFKIEQEHGMTNLLVGKKKIDEVLCPTDVPNLQVIPCGPIPPNPSEILGSKKMQSVIDELKQNFDKVIIDSAPVAAVTDSLMVANAVDGVIFIVRPGTTHKKIAVTAVATLAGIGATVLGAVLNGLDTRGAGYHYYPGYHYHYGYLYGDGGHRSRRENLLKKLPAISSKTLKKIFRV